MKKLLSLAVAILFVAPFFTSCDDDEEIPAAEVVIKNKEGKVITGDTIEVKIGTGAHTEFFITYHYNDANKHRPFEIWRQTDDNEPEDLSPKLNDELEPTSMHEDLSGGPTLLSSTGYGNQKYYLRTAFSTKMVHMGSIVEIGARTSEAKGEVWYKVVE